MKKKTLSGRSKNGEKQTITPEKKDILESLFAERIKFLPVEEVDETRKRNLSKLIRNALEKAGRVNKTGYK